MQNNQTQNSKERGTAYGTAVLFFIFVFMVCVVVLVAKLTAPALQNSEQEDVRQTINAMFDGNSGFKDITEDFRTKGHLEGADGVVSVYLVKSGTGGEDGYCILSKSAGYNGDVQLLVGFGSDGVISGVKSLGGLVSTQGIVEGSKEEEFLARFGGLASNAEGIKIDGISGATVSSTAAVKAVNSACIAISSFLGLNEEVSG